jgi:hypothetical protein
LESYPLKTQKSPYRDQITQLWDFFQQNTWNKPVCYQRAGSNTVQLVVIWTRGRDATSGGNRFRTYCFHPQRSIGSFFRAYWPLKMKAVPPLESSGYPITQQHTAEERTPTPQRETSGWHSCIRV